MFTLWHFRFREIILSSVNCFSRLIRKGVIWDRSFQQTHTDMNMYHQIFWCVVYSRVLCIKKEEAMASILSICRSAAYYRLGYIAHTQTHKHTEIRPLSMAPAHFPFHYITLNIYGLSNAYFSSRILRSSACLQNCKTELESNLFSCLVFRNLSFIL